MVVLSLIGILVGFFGIFYFFGTVFPIIRRSLLIPLTFLFLVLFGVELKKITPPSLTNPFMLLIREGIQKALGFDLLYVGYWLLLFLGWILLSGIILFALDLFMRDRAGEIFREAEKHLSLYGLRNILVISCFLIPFMIFIGIYYNFATSSMIFVSLICFAGCQIEVLSSSANKKSGKINDKSILFLTSFSLINVFLLVISLVVLLATRL